MLNIDTHSSFMHPLSFSKCVTYVRLFQFRVRKRGTTSRACQISINMSELMLTNAIGSLFEVAEVNSIGGVPLDVGIEALMLVNPDLEPQQAQSIAVQLDSRGRQVLSKDDFVEAVRFVLSDVDSSEAVHMINDLVLRMRMTYRRRYLMYDAPANRCAPALLQNVRTVEMYREMFDMFANGGDYISRHDLRTLAHEVLPEYPTDAANIVKAAIGEGERDAIGFEEFIMVMQPTTSRRQLSEMIKLARSKILGTEDTPVRGQYHGGDSYGMPSQQPQQHHQQGVATLTSSLQPWREAEDELLSPKTNRPATPPAPSPATPLQAGPVVGSRPRRTDNPSSSTLLSSPTGGGTLHHELQQAKQHHEAAEAVFESVLSGSQRVNLSTISRLSDVGAAMKMPSLMERELAQLRMENEELKHKVSQFQLYGGGGARGSSPQHRRHSATGGGPPSSSEQEAYIAELENELRSTRAQLAVRTEAGQLIALLNKSNTTEEGLRKYYHDERTLISKQEYLRSVSSTLHEGDGTSPISLVLSQYDLIVCGYQALYREMKRRFESGGGGGGSKRDLSSKRFDSATAASSIVPRNVPIQYSVPPRGLSPSRTYAVPLSWQELDADVSNEMKGTGTLRDPLLTAEERNHLRGKLAAQMRGAARHYTPKKQRADIGGYHQSSRIHRHDDEHVPNDADFQQHQQLMPGAATQMASHDAVSRLHSLQHQAIKQRKL